ERGGVIRELLRVRERRLVRHEEHGVQVGPGGVIVREHPVRSRQDVFDFRVARRVVIDDVRVVLRDVDDPVVDAQEIVAAVLVAVPEQVVVVVADRGRQVPGDVRVDVAALDVVLDERQRYVFRPDGLDGREGPAGGRERVSGGRSGRLTGGAQLAGRGEELVEV